MSGHSKWSTIKHKKAVKDQRRGAIFSKLAKEITVAAKEGGSGDPVQNPRLRAILEKARAANMPSTNISRAIERGLGKGSGGAAEEVIYEGYGPAGIAIIAMARTDNRQRTSSELKHLFEKAGGSLGVLGSAAYLFERKDAVFTAKVYLPIHGKEIRSKLESFLQELGNRDDIKVVYSNHKIDDE